MTPNEVVALRALCEQATPGPWQWDVDDADMTAPCALPAPHRDEDEVRPTGHECEAFPVERDDAGLVSRWEYHVPIIITDSGYYPPRENDRAFIAAARTALPELLEELEAANKCKGQLRKEMAGLLQEVARLKADLRDWHEAEQRSRPYL